MKTLLLLIASLCAFSQGVSTVPGGVGKASNNIILRGSGNTLPATCVVGQQFFKTNATAGQNLYGCTSTNTWTAQGGSSTGLGDPGSNGIVYRNGSGTSTTATATEMAGPLYCADAGASDTYACSLSPAPSGYTTGATYIFKANTSNTGAATINFNSLGAKTIVKVAGGVTTTLADNDIRAGQIVEVVYDGTNMQMQSTLGNAGGGNSTSTGTYASATASTAGNIYFPNDSAYIMRDTGSSFAPWGPAWPLTIPDAVGGWTQINAGSATFDSTYGAIRIFAPAASGDNYRILTKTAPATPWKLTVLMEWLFWPVDYPGAGIGFRQSSDGKMHVCGLQRATNALFVSKKMNSATSNNSDYSSVNYFGNNPAWLQIEDNGTNRVCRYSLNGKNWTDFHSIGRTDFLTADEYWIGVQSINTTYAAEVVFHSVKVD